MPQGVNLEYWEKVRKQREAERMKLRSMNQNEITEKEKGKNAALLESTLMGFNLPTIDTSDPQQIVKRASEYFSHCIDYNERPGTADLCVWLGCTRQTWYSWVRGESRQTTHQAVCQRINQLLDSQLEKALQQNLINPVSAIFLMKNNLGYRDAPPPEKEQKPTALIEQSMEDVMKLAEFYDKAEKEGKKIKRKQKQAEKNKEGK